MGSIEKVMVAGILVIICVILGIAIWGAESLDDGSLEPTQAAHKSVAEKPAAEPSHAPATAAAKPEQKSPDLKNEAEKTAPQGEEKVALKPPAAESTATTATDTDPLAPATKTAETTKTAAPPKEAVLPTAKKEAEHSPEAKPDANAVWQYTVKKGDTFSAIAQHFYGSAGAASRIARMNEDAEEHGLKVGQVLTMPPVSSAAAGKATASWYSGKEPKLAANAPKAGQQKTYIVREGDTLIRIAREVLGTERWQKLYELNKDRLDSATSLKPGQELILPSD